MAACARRVLARRPSIDAPPRRRYYRTPPCTAGPYFCINARSAIAAAGANMLGVGWVVGLCFVPRVTARSLGIPVAATQAMAYCFLSRFP